MTELSEKTVDFDYVVDIQSKKTVQSNSVVDEQSEKTTDFDNMIDEYSDVVTRICLVHTGSLADAEDCYQNVFFKLYKQLSKAKPANVKAWIIKVAVNECRSMMRFRLRKSTVNLEDMVLPHFDNYQTELAEAISRLQPKVRDIIYLYYYEEYSVKEISEIIGTKENTVKSHLKRGRERLKAFLDDE